MWDLYLGRILSTDNILLYVDKLNRFFLRPLVQFVCQTLVALAAVNNFVQVSRFTVLLLDLNHLIHPSWSLKKLFKFGCLAS